MNFTQHWLYYIAAEFRKISLVINKVINLTLTKGGSLVATWAECQHIVVDDAIDGTEKDWKSV